MRTKVHFNGKISPELLPVLQKHVSEKLELYPEDYEHEYMRGTVKGYHYTANVSKILHDPDLQGVRFEVQGSTCEPHLFESMIDRLEAIEEKLQRYTYNGAVETQQLNKRVEVHVPGIGLLLMNEIRLEEDCCTNHLSNLLEEGWRIIAVCPQPDQRRPDYVLGRQSRND
jgi:hypothetical protein